MTPHLLQHICHHHTQISLKHPFDDCYGRAAKDSRGTTPLLMDYTDGTHIAKWQWSEIYQPALIGAVFEREERGEMRNEGERAKITRFLYALKDMHLGKTISFFDSDKLKTEDKEWLRNINEKNVSAEKIYYDYKIENFFDKVILSIKTAVEYENIDKTRKENEALFYVKKDKIYIKLSFSSKDEALRFSDFINSLDDIKLQQNPNRKAFFIHGTQSDSDRWKEHPLTENVLLMIANTNLYDDGFEWKDLCKLTNDVPERQKAAQMLVKYVLANSDGVKEIVLIGHSHGGNVALQAANDLTKYGKKVYIVTVATPAYNQDYIFRTNMLSGCGCIQSSSNLLLCKNPENPQNCSFERHIQLWNKVDGISGEISDGSDIRNNSDDYYTNDKTENVEIPTGEEFDTELDIKAIFSNYHLVKELVSPAFDAHSLDAYRPQLIYKLIVNKSITL